MKGLKNIAIYGGAFDPPHIGHVSLVNSLLKAPGVDQVWLMPCGDREDKKLLLPKSKRLYLMQLLFEGTPRLKISEQEIEMSTKLGRAVHTYDLLNNIKQKYEGSCFSMVVGGDVLLTIHTWGNSAALQKENPFIIFHRKGYEIPVEKLPPQHTIIESQLPEISSSYIKGLIQDSTVSREQKRKILKPWLDERVFSYLIQQQLI